MAGNGELKPTNGIRKPGASRKPAPAPKKKKDKVEKKETIQKKSTSSFQKQPKIKKNYSDGRFSRKKKVPLVLLSVAGLLVVIMFASLLSYTYLVDRYENPITVESIEIDEATKVTFKISKGANSSDVAKALKKADLISSVWMYKLLSNFNGYDSKYTAGTHYLSKGLNYDEIMVILSSEPETVKVTFPEGFTTVQIAERLEANGVVSKKAFLEAVNEIELKSYSFISNFDKNRDYRLEGYLFPDTYEFDIESDVENVIYKMLNRFNEKYLPEYYTRAEEIGLSMDQVVVLASLVEREAKLSKERDIIAGVYMNRLLSDEFDFLQCDATVQYAYKKEHGETADVITAEILAMDDLYNTYLYAGLPPGPICSPSISAIEAVLYYEEHDYYYYVVSKDNPRSHIFSKTFEEHEAAVEANRTQQE